MKFIIKNHLSAIRFRSAISSPAILLTSAFMAWVSFSGTVTAAMLADSEPTDWPADPTRHVVTIRREAKDDKQAAIIAAAEAAQPSKEVLCKAADAGDRDDRIESPPQKEAPLPAGDKVWWYKEQLGIRIPCAITSDAVSYYSDLVKKYGKLALNRYVQPSSRLDYRSSVKFHKEFDLDDKTFNDIHVVTLKLNFRQDCAATQTYEMSFEKERIVILDAKSKVLHISGDGPTEVMIVAL